MQVQYKDIFTGHDVIYFVINGNRDLIKIGRTTDIRSRMTSIRVKEKSDCLCCGVIENLTHHDAIMLELKLHNKFIDDNVRGEWFKRSDRLNNYIVNCPDICFPSSWRGCYLLYDLKNNKDISIRFGTTRTYGANDVNNDYGELVYLMRR